MGITLAAVIDQVDALKHNAFTDQQKTDFINDIEAQIYTDVLLISADDFTPKVYDTDSTDVLVVDDAHLDVYRLWLESMIDRYNGEIDKYNASAAMFNAAYRRYKNYIASTYEIANFRDTDAAVYHMHSAGTPTVLYLGTVTFDATSGAATSLYSIPANMIITRMVVEVDAAFDSSSDVLILGVSTDADAFFDADDIDTHTIGTYQKPLWYSTGVNGVDIYYTLTKSGTTATAGSALVYVEYVEAA